MKVTQEKIIGFSGSALFIILLIFLLYLIVIRTEAKVGDEGILVNYGTVDWAAGTFEPRNQSHTPVVPQEAASPEQSVPQENNTPPVVTQDLEETVALDAAQQEAERKRLEREREAQEQLRLAEEQRLRAEEERRQREALDREMAGAFGAGDQSDTSEGTAETGSGNQGSTEGNAPTGAYAGVGGYGEFDLGGRSLGEGGLPRPDYNVSEEGKIVIDITVNPAGSVITASIGKGTDISNQTLRESALKAARMAKFNSINGTNNQSGTVTYRYSLK